MHYPFIAYDIRIGFDPWEKLALPEGLFLFTDAKVNVISRLLGQTENLWIWISKIL